MNDAVVSIPSSPKKKPEVLSSLGFANGCCCCGMANALKSMLMVSKAKPAPCESITMLRVSCWVIVKGVDVD